MPVRSLHSSVFIWPSQAEVKAALQTWLPEAARRHPELLRLGLFGSFARGDWGVGSDLDLVAIVESSDKPFERRAVDWDLNALPGPVELLVYTRAEWQRMEQEGGRFAATLAEEVIWSFTRAAPS